MKYIREGEKVRHATHDEAHEWKVEDMFSHGEEAGLSLVRTNEEGMIEHATMGACEWYEHKIGRMIEAVNNLPKSKAKTELLAVMDELNFK